MSEGAVVSSHLLYTEVSCTDKETEVTLIKSAKES